MTAELFLAICAVSAAAISVWLAIQNRHRQNNIEKLLDRLERNKANRSDEAPSE